MEKLKKELYDIISKSPGYTEGNFFNYRGLRFYANQWEYICIKDSAGVEVSFKRDKIKIDDTTILYGLYSIEIFVESLIEYLNGDEEEFIIEDNLFIPETEESDVGKINDLVRDNNKMVEELQEQKEKILNLEMMRDSDKNKIDGLVSKIQILDNIINKFISNLIDAV